VLTNSDFWWQQVLILVLLASGQIKTKRGNLPWGILSQQNFIGRGQEKLAIWGGKKKDLQFNISHLVAKTRCIFIGSLAKSGNEIIFRWETDQMPSSVGEVQCLVCFLRLNLWLWWNVGLNSRSFRYGCIPYFVKMCSKVTKQSNTYMMLI